MHLELNDQLAENVPETAPKLDKKKLQNLGWGMHQGRQSDRFQRLETQVKQLTQTLSALGPVLQQVLHTQQAQQSTSNMPQRPDPPSVAPPFNPGSVHQTPGQASESNPLPSQTFHQTTAQAAGIPDQPFPTSMPQLNLVCIPKCHVCPPGLSQIPMSQTGLFPGMPSNPASVGQPPIQVDTQPHGSHRETGEDNPFKRSERWMPNILEITGFLSWLIHWPVGQA